jgi:hypothetical protein
MTILIIFTIIVLLSALFSLREKGTFHKIIAFGFVFPILLSWVENRIVLLAGLCLIMLLGLLTGIYGLKEKGLSAIERIGISTMGFCFMLSVIFKIMHLPEAWFMRLIMVVPVAIYLIGLLVNKKAITKEMSFMITWIFLVIIEIISFVG